MYFSAVIYKLSINIYIKLMPIKQVLENCYYNVIMIATNHNTIVTRMFYIYVGENQNTFLNYSIDYSVHDILFILSGRM